MIDNFLQLDQISEYHSYDRIYTHQSGYSIYLGDASAANNLQFINHSQIGLVVTAAINMEHLNYDHNQKKIKHLIYSLLDSKTQNMAKYFTQFYQLVESEIRGTNILVHCFAGISRSATLVISYLMKKNKFDFKQAIAQVRKFRPTVLPNLGFERQLKQYQKILKLQQLSITRKLISKTSQSRKHSKKLPEIGLPQILALGKTIVRPKVFQLQAPPLLLPSSQMQARKIRLGKLELIRQFTAEQKGGYNYYQRQPLTNRIPIKSFRKRSVSITNKKQRNIRQSLRQIQQLKLPHKLAINDIKFGTERVIKSLALKDLYQ